MFDRPLRLISAAVAATLLVWPAQAQTVVQESGFWAAEVAKGQMDPAAERIPDTPLIVDLEAKGRTFGSQGGTLRTMVTRSKDVRQMVVYGYARLVGYDHEYKLAPDILRDFEVEEGRIFTLHLRPGHRWSDGAPLTSADFEYWWKHVANNAELNPNGPPEIMRSGGVATMTFPDDLTVVVEYPEANPRFLPAL
ncbi:MAG: ABC transporter substrate-binding protein, partial [Pseudomonadota bacterium]